MIRKKVALIGFSTIESIGLRTIVHEFDNTFSESFANFEEMGFMAEKYDFFIVSPQVFIAKLDFFLPKKFKTLIISNPYEGIMNSEGLSIISDSSDESVLKETLGKTFNHSQPESESKGELSSREIEVLKLIAEGKINKEIADKLCISINTVITHRKNISSKLGIKSASGMSLYALMNGLI